MTELTKATQRRCDIVGSHFRPPATAILGVLPTGAKLQLRHQPVPPSASFAGDPNAIAIYTATSEIPDAAQDALTLLAADCGWTTEIIMAQPEFQIGYIPAKAAAATRISTPVDGILTFSLEGRPQVEFTPK